MHLFHPSLLLPVNLSVFPPSTSPDPLFIKISFHLPFIHPPAERDWRAWSQCRVGQIGECCLQYWDGGNVRGEELGGKLQQNGEFPEWKGRDCLFTFSTFFYSSFATSQSISLPISPYIYPTIQYVYPYFLPPPLPHIHSSSIKLTLPLIPCEVWI